MRFALTATYYIRTLRPVDEESRTPRTCVLSVATLSTRTRYPPGIRAPNKTKSRPADRVLTVVRERESTRRVRTGSESQPRHRDHAFFYSYALLSILLRAYGMSHVRSAAETHELAPRHPSRD